MRTVYLGTSAFAAAILTRLANSDHRPSLVVTRPDRPRGRGRTLQSPPVADRARELGIALDQPQSVNDDAARERIAAARPDAVIVCAFGALIREPLLSDYEMINVHPSLLPRWRGAAPVERAIMAGDTATGVAIMRLTAGLDSGPVCLVQREAIADTDTYGTLAARLETIGGEMLVRVLDQHPPFEEQDETGVTYAEKIGPEDRRLDPTTKSAAELDRVVRALTPHIGALLPLDGETLLGVREAAPFAGVAPQLAPGTFGATDGHLLLGTTDGILELKTLQPSGGKPMDAASYLRGHGLPH